MPASDAPAFEMFHTVGFAETNLVGNVYFTRHLEWQGRCREMFLHEHCPTILASLRDDLALVTLHCSCDYVMEFSAFDRVLLRMRLDDLAHNRIGLAFDYYRCGADGRRAHAARGRQVLASMRRQDGELRPTPVPEALLQALGPYRVSHPT
ncbi:acyl-CoA thioesterase [Luteibacter anthropi]|uniref:Acyl-CoA thioesterase n=2 Tax=Luteibacter anthropi TaxID=564369 RepID=A0A7X5UBB0_9GAMM|nr:acyl-CoA thioesterase [Luteibacter anthropi]